MHRESIAAPGDRQRARSALAYGRELGARRTAVAALLQATSLPFLVAAAQIGVELGTIDATTAAALVGAGILSVLVFPFLSLTLLRGGASRPEEAGG